MDDWIPFLLAAILGCGIISAITLLMILKGFSEFDDFEHKYRHIIEKQKKGH